MADVKSQDDYLSIYSALLMDVEGLTGLNLARDYETISNRTKMEGLSFLTKTLPSFYKHILTCVEQSRFTVFAGLKHDRTGPLPKFLRGLVDGLFDSDGLLLQDRVSPYLGYIGQICTFMYKCEFPYTQSQVEKRLRKFKEVENELPETLGRLSDFAETVLRNAIELGSQLFRGFTVTEVPKHGPGAVAGREKAAEKYDFTFSDRIDDIFPWGEWFGSYRTTAQRLRTTSRPGPGIFCNIEIPPEGMQEDTMWDPLLELLVAEDLDDALCQVGTIPPARGLFVNKDSRGPRYISAEPKELMWLQQAVGRSIVKWLESHELTKGHVNFKDQTINGNLALQSSIDRLFATLDLEDASDRVSLAIVRLLLPSDLVRLLEACRSNAAVLPDGGIMELKKFAPMGSACCFPIESVVFFLLSTACVMTLTGKDPIEAKESVYVYGDDIIVSRQYAKRLTELLPEFLLAVNAKKSFWLGPFRESCGVDAIDGYDITPVKLRKPVPSSKADVSTLISWLDTSNQLFYAGLWKAADCMAAICRRYTQTPYVPYQSGLFGVTGYKSAIEIRRKPLKWSKRYHALSIKLRVVKPTEVQDWSRDQTARGSLLHSLTRLRDDEENLSFLWGRQEASTMFIGSGSFLRLSYSQLVLS